MTQEKADLINALLEIEDRIDELWEYHPDNPKKINVEQEYAKLCAEIAGIEGELAALHS